MIARSGGPDGAVEAGVFMALAIDQDTIISRLAELRARRPSLALRAARGDDGARRELAAVDADARAYETDLEVLALADQETRRLAVAEQEAAIAEERRRLEMAYTQAEAARAAAYERVERVLDELVAHVRAAMDAARDLDRLGAAMGRRPMTSWAHATAGQLAARIVGRLGGDGGLRGLVPPVDGSRPLVGGA